MTATTLTPSASPYSSEAIGESQHLTSLLLAGRSGRLPNDTWSLATRPRDPKDLARYLAAAAFSGGAVFLLSATKRRGLRGPIDFVSAERLQQAGLDRVSPRLDVECQRVADHKGAALVVEVASYNLDHAPPRTVGRPPYEGVFELRRGRPHSVASKAVTVLERAAGVTPDELEPADFGTLRGLSQSHLDRLTTAIRVPSDHNGWTALHELGVLANPYSHASPTVAAAAAMGLPASAFVWRPQIELRTHPYGLAEAASGILGPSAPLVLTGGFLVIRKDLMTALAPFARNNPMAARAITEAVINAVGHRSYAPEHRKRPIFIEHYIDALLIRSPGAPLARVEMLDESGPQHRFARNPRLMNLLRLFGYARSLGTGRSLLLRGQDTGLEPARFEAGADWFGVALEVHTPRRLPGVRCSAPRFTGQFVVGIQAA